VRGCIVQKRSDVCTGWFVYHHLLMMVKGAVFVVEESLEFMYCCASVLYFASPGARAVLDICNVCCAVDDIAAACARGSKYNGQYTPVKPVQQAPAATHGASDCSAQDAPKTTWPTPRQHICPTSVRQPPSAGHR
jgi:hypothetical protein